MASAGITTDSGTKGSAPGSSRAAPVPITIDKSQFDTVRKTHGVEVTAKQCNAARKLLNTFIIRQRHQKPIVDSPSFVDEGTGRPLKRIILRPDIGSAQDTSEVLAKLSDEAREFIETHGLKIVPHEVHEGYDNLNAEQVLRKLLPAGVEVPTSFESVGHIAHFNLRDEQLPYRYLIGQVFLEKSNRQITTVLNKTGIIQTVFRTFPLEVIAGEPNTLVRVSEGGARFQFDYATVYWNSRLQFEHRRLVGVRYYARVLLYIVSLVFTFAASLFADATDSFSRSDVVCDMMCGIGPFAIPSALKGCTVYANDLNPESYKYAKNAQDFVAV